MLRGPRAKEYLSTGGSPKSCELVRVAKGVLEQHQTETGRSALLKAPCCFGLRSNSALVHVGTTN